ncbi:MAG: class A beta-lactamase [Luteolibacter sp.]
MRPNAGFFPTLLAFLYGLTFLHAQEKPDAFAALEAKNGGKLGLAAIDLQDRRTLTHRADERFPLCSTFKLPLAAAVAARIDAGKETWDHPVSYGKKQLVPYSPVTGGKENLRNGKMSLAKLCEAAITLSDNTAANLLLDTIDGPEGFNRFLVSLGDTTTFLERREPALNSSTVGDPRDTTTPAAMLATMEKLLVGPTLQPASREKLIGWLVATRTGDKRIRAGMPAGWKVGDKTGTCGNGATNDIAIVWPPGREPILLAIYYYAPQTPSNQREAVIAEAARQVREHFVPQP